MKVNISITDLIYCEYCGAVFCPNILTIKQLSETRFIWVCGVCGKDNDANYEMMPKIKKIIVRK